MKVEVVTISNMVHRIAVPYGMDVPQAWERIQVAYGEGVDPWPSGTLIKYYCEIITRPSGRLVAVQVG